MVRRDERTIKIERLQRELETAEREARLALVRVATVANELTFLATDQFRRANDRRVNEPG